MTITETRLRSLTVNGAPVASAAATLAELIADQGFVGLKVATAVNGDFIPERRRADTLLTDGDRIEILSARQGG